MTVAIISAMAEENAGDIVIAKQLYQHDIDASPIIPRHEIPLLGRAEIESYPIR